MKENTPKFTEQDIAQLARKFGTPPSPERKARIMENARAYDRQVAAEKAKAKASKRSGKTKS